MTWVVLILAGSLFAYASNRFSLQSISLAVICALALVYGLAPGPMQGPVTPAFSGLASEALVAIVGLMVLGKALMMTGALRPLATALSALLARVPRAAFILVLVGGFAISGFLNDTPVVVMLLPVLLGAAAQASKPAGPMLMPMNYAVILGGMMTAIGTSTNLLVNGLSGANGGPTFDFFDFYLIALPAALLGLSYLVLVAPRLLRRSGEQPRPESATRFLATLRIDASSPLVDKPLYKLRKQLGGQVAFRHLMRRHREMARFPTLRAARGRSARSGRHRRGPARSRGPARPRSQFRAGEHQRDRRADGTRAATTSVRGLGGQPDCRSFGRQQRPALALRSHHRRFVGTGIGFPHPESG
ncbi:MAG: SLC13 family permease [Burkholderiaceae bacterium]